MRKARYEFDCDCCGRVFVILAYKNDMDAHFADIVNGTRTKAIQDRFPYLEPWERQLIMDERFGGGVCDDCFRRIHGFPILKNKTTKKGKAR